MMIPPSTDSDNERWTYKKGRHKVYPEVCVIVRASPLNASEIIIAHVARDLQINIRLGSRPFFWFDVTGGLLHLADHRQ